MDNLTGFRLISPAGFSRVEVPRNGTFGDIKQAITVLLKVHPKEQKLFYDMGNKKSLNYPDNTPLSKIGLR